VFPWGVAAALLDLFCSDAAVPFVDAAVPFADAAVLFAEDPVTFDEAAVFFSAATISLTVAAITVGFYLELAVGFSDVGYCPTSYN